MNELDDCGHFLVALTLVVQRACSQQHQGWAHPLTTAANDVFGDLSDQNNVGIQAITDDRIDGLHIGPNQGIELFQSHGRQFLEEARNLRWRKRGSQGRKYNDTRCLADSLLNSKD